MTSAISLQPHNTFYLSPLAADTRQRQPIRGQLPACDARLVSRTEAASSYGFVKNTNPLSVQLCRGFHIQACTQRWLCISVDSLCASHKLFRIFTENKDFIFDEKKSILSLMMCGFDDHVITHMITCAQIKLNSF